MTDTTSLPDELPGVVSWADLQADGLAPRGINIKWIANANFEARWPNNAPEWHIGGWKGGAEGAIITGPISGMAHVPYAGIWHEPAYGPPRYERKVDKRREISTRILLISDTELGWFDTEARWWDGMDGDLPGYWSIFTQRYGELWCPMQLLECSDTPFENDPTDSGFNAQEWDILLAADGEPRWRQPDLRPATWVNDMSITTEVLRDDELLAPMVTVGVGKFRIANRGTEPTWPVFTVSAPGRCWLPNGVSGQMIRVPYLNPGEHVTIDTNPQNRIAISDIDPVTSPFKTFVSNSELLTWLFGTDFADSGQTVLERFRGQGFDQPIAAGTVATLPVFHSQPGARISVSLPQLFERAIS